MYSPEIAGLGELVEKFQISLLYGSSGYIRAYL